MLFCKRFTYAVYIYTLLAIFPALEVIGEQEKVLQDTRDVFDKTVRFFVVEDQSEVNI